MGSPHSGKRNERGVLLLDPPAGGVVGELPPVPRVGTVEAKTGRDCVEAEVGVSPCGPARLPTPLFVPVAVELAW